MKSRNQQSKKCSKCDKKQSIKRFHKDKQKKDGLCSVCKACNKQRVNEYYISHKEARDAKNLKYYELNKETINRNKRKHPEISGCGTFNKMYPDHFDFGASLRKPFGEASFARLVRQYKAAAKRRNLLFTLIDEDVRTITSSRCCYCGVKPYQSMNSCDANGPYIYNGIDRINNEVGYIRENCVPACGLCNKAKSNLSIEQWNEWLDRILAFHKK